MSVTAKWSSGLDFEGRDRYQNVIQLSGETSRGYKPLELFLLGLAGCTGMDVISILQKKKQNVSAFTVEVSGVRADEHPRVYTSIHVTYNVSGVGIDPKAVERAVELSETKYCPASAMLSKSVAITHTINIINEA